MFWRLTLKLVCCVSAMMLATAIDLRAQSVDPRPGPEDEQTEAFRDTLARMKIEREENEHKKLKEKAAKILETVAELEKEASRGPLSRVHDKKLREIEKSAKQIRSEFGGSGDEFPLEQKPPTVADALRQLHELSERLTESMEKTSRRVVSTAVIFEASEIVELVKLIRGHIN